MRSRLDKYNDNSGQKEVKSRLAKNKYLYDDLNNKIGFEEMVDFDTQTRIELTSLNEPRKSRESYQQLKDYQEIMGSLSVDQKEVPEEEKEKIFDINTILEEARKNRNEIDELEGKRKLKNEEYSILSDLNKKYLSKENIQEPKEKEEYEGLEELIHTITSKTLVNDISKIEEESKTKTDQDLLSDLIATSVDLQVKEPSQYEKSDAQQVTISDDEQEDTSSQQIDDSFYTKSMDLSNQDFEFDDIKERHGGVKRVLLILLITIILLVVVGVVIYFILQSVGINILDFINNN